MRIEIIIYAVLVVVLYAILYLFATSVLKKYKPRKGIFELVLFFNHLNIKGVIKMVQLTRTQTVSGILQPVDRLGNPAPIEPGSVKFSSSDESVFIVQVDEIHEKKLKIVPIGAGVAELSYSADADLGEGVVTIEGFTGVEVKPAEAVGFGVKFDVPVEVPASVEETTAPELPQSPGPDTAPETSGDATQA